MGQLAVVEWLQGARAVLDALDAAGEQPLHGACRRGHAPIISHLLAAGVRIDAPAADGWQPIHLASLSGSAAAVAALLGRGADADARAAGLKPLLDPLAEHRTWSPWLAVTAGDTVPAWMRLVALLRPAPSPAAAAAKGTKRSASAALSSVIAMI